MRERFFGVLIAALIAVCLLAGAGAYLVNKIIYEANLDLNEEQENNLNNFKEPEVLAVSVASEESESEDLILSSEDANGDLDLNNLEPEPENKIYNANIINNVKDDKDDKDENKIKSENKNNLKNNIKPKSRRVRTKVNKKDLSEYKVKAIKADEDDFMPEDTSKSVQDLKTELNVKKKVKTFDGGKGLIGDIYRGAKKIVDGADKATLDTSRKVIGETMNLDINKARLRPGGGGVKLHLDISPKAKDKNKNLKINNKNK
ncbi:MAG: hypothetical protein II948_01635 [Synergistaceae bacterium]|nr:hypothetical protein [Synergistaceae bacterium]